MAHTSHLKTDLDLQKRKRREYRQARKQQFKRPEHNFSMYEGRTRGKRMKYTYSEDEDDVYSDATTSRRSTRNTGTHTPAEGPTVTLSGRQVKSRQGGTYGESMLSGNNATASAFDNLGGTSEEPEEGGEHGSRPRRAAAAKATTNGWATTKAHIEGYNSVDEMSSEDAASEQDYGDDEEEEDIQSITLESDVEDGGISDEADELDEKQSLVVKLPVKTPTPERKVLEKPQAVPEALQSSVPIDFSSAASGLNSKEASLSTEVPSKPIDIPTSQAPLSPLAFRGSPEKARVFPPSVDVGYGGS